SPTLSAGCVGTLAAGEQKTCTISNDDQPAHLLVKKHVVNDSGGTKSDSDFSTTVTGGSPSRTSFSGSENGTPVTLTAGSYAVDEAPAVGYAKTLGSGCTGTLAPGETRTCTITNDDVSTTLRVVKHVVNDNGGTALAGNWMMTVTGNSPSPASFAGSEAGTLVTFNPGSYSVSESGPGGYTATLSAAGT